MLEGRPRSWTKRPRGAPWSRGGRTWPGPTANWRPPRGSSTHGPTTSLRSPWCVLWPTPGLWLATHRRRSELGSGSERQANEAGTSRAGALRKLPGQEELLVRYDQGNGLIRLLQMITVACALRGASVVDRPVGRGPEVQ